MEYSVRVWSATCGDAIPLYYVAEAMARHAAMGFGTLPLHVQTLVELRPKKVALLLGAARTGKQTVCDSHGGVATATEVICAAEIPADSGDDVVLANLYAKAQHLMEWGAANGDVFRFVETPGMVFSMDRRQWTGESNWGEVIEPGYYRGFFGGGETERYEEAVNASEVVLAASGKPVAAISSNAAGAEGALAVGSAPGQNPTAPVQRQAAQDAAIRETIRALGHDPLALPTNSPGKPGVKAAVRAKLMGKNKLFPAQGKVFDKAWERFRQTGT